MSRRNGRPGPWAEYRAIEAQVATCPMNGPHQRCRWCKRDLRHARIRLTLSALAYTVVALFYVFILWGSVVTITTIYDGLRPAPVVTNYQLPTE